MTIHLPSIIATTVCTREIQSSRLLGLNAIPDTISHTPALNETAVTQWQKITVFYHNLHSLCACFTLERIRQCYDKALALVDAPALFPGGSRMEFVAGAINTPPHWLGKTGLEWSDRLFENPKLFSFSYLVEPILVAGILLRSRVLPAGTDR